MSAPVKKIKGTSQNEFYIGLGDITQAGENIIGFRTNGSGIAEYREAGDVWKPLVAAGSFDVDTILVDDVTDEVLVDDIANNVLVNN